MKKSVPQNSDSEMEADDPEPLENESDSDSFSCEIDDGTPEKFNKTMKRAIKLKEISKDKVKPNEVKDVLFMHFSGTGLRHTIGVELKNFSVMMRTMILLRLK